MAASTQCSYSTKSNTYRMEPTWATSLCRLYSPKGSWEAVFCPVEMTACFYTYWLKKLHPHLTAVPTKPDFQTFTQNLGLLRNRNRTFHWTLIRQKEKSAEHPLMKWKKHILMKNTTITSHESSIQMPPVHWVHLRRTCSTDVTFLSTLSFSHSHPVLFVLLLLLYHQW